MSDFDQLTTKFESWLVQNEVDVSSKVKIKNFLELGRGLVAIEDIQIDEVLFKIPRKIIFNINNNSLTRKYPDLKVTLSKMNNQWQCLIIILFYEIQLEENSPWLDYLNILPNSSFNQLIFWNPKELKTLKPSCILERIGRESAREMYDNICDLITQFDIPGFTREKFTFDEYNAIATLIQSYSFDVVDETVEEVDEEDEFLSIKSMIPLADILNADTNLNNAKLFHEDKYLIMKSIQPIAKDEQIFNTYSDHPNSEILRRYGYVESKGSKFDFGEVPISLIKQYFIDKYDSSLNYIDSVVDYIKQVCNDEEDDDEKIELILDSYDCFKNNEVIIELIFLLQILTIIFQIKDDIDVSFKSINKIFKKCYQLIEMKKITHELIINFENILQARLDQYPSVAKEPFDSETVPLDRGRMAEIVLKSEYQSISNCMKDINQTINNVIGPCKIIHDDKLIRNILKHNEGNGHDNKKRRIQ